jgi:tetratricopeptide (TPR) repeat protein
MARSNLAGVLDDTGHREQAEAEKRAVLEIFVEAYGPDHPHALSARQNLALTLGGRGKHGDAVDELRKVIAGLEAKSDADPTIATVRLNLGVELLELGRADEAIEELLRGLDMRIETIGETSLDVAEARTELARALLDHDRADEALPIASASWATFAKGDGPPIRRAWSAFSFARAVRATGGDAAEARRLAETARDMLEPTHGTRATIEAWLRDADD